MSKRAMIIAYVCLVGIPLLGLIGILHGGRRLQAPLAVGGNWNLEADFSSWAGKPCGDLLASAKQPALSISQSGTTLVVALNNPQATTLAGTVEGTSLTVGDEEPASLESESCNAAQALRLNGEVNRDGAHCRLTGTLKLNNCASCAVIAFQAVRQTTKKGGA